MNKCPRCGSPKPELHPAVQYEGEVQPCSAAFHFKVTPENTMERIIEAQGSDAMTPTCICGEGGAGDIVCALHAYAEPQLT